MGHSVWSDMMGKPVSASEVDAKAANLGGQQEHKHSVVGIEVVHQPRSRTNCC